MPAQRLTLIVDFVLDDSGRASIIKAGFVVPEPSPAADAPSLKVVSTDIVRAGGTQVVVRKACAAQIPPGFAAFWTSYPENCPRRVGKAQALEYWIRNRLDDVADDVLRALAFWKESHDWKKDGGTFIATPIVWLRKRPWEDDMPLLDENVGQASDEDVERQIRRDLEGGLP